MNSTNSMVPVMELVNSVITKTSIEEFELKEGVIHLGDKEGYCYISLIDYKGEWAANGILKSFADHLDALVTTYTSSQDILVIGQNKNLMAETVNQLITQGGGTILRESEAILFNLQLPLQGKMSKLPMPELISKTSELVSLLKERGHPHYDPFYTMFFFTSTHLPSVRVTAEGIYSVKENASLFPVKRI